MKKYFLALAMSFAVTSVAHAAWNPGNDPMLIDGNGEMILLVFDPITRSSYAQDLGITFNQLRAGFTGAVNLDPAHVAVFGGNYSNAQFALFAGSNTAYTADLSALNYSERGFIYSLVSGQSIWQTNADTHFPAVEYALAHLDVINTNTFSQLDPTIENPGYSAGGQGYAGNGVQQYESDLNRNLSEINGGAVELWLKGFNQDDGYGEPLNQLLGTATLNLENSTIVFTTTVPVPAAAWLFGGALIGLGGFKNRRALAN